MGLLVSAWSLARSLDPLKPCPQGQAVFQAGPIHICSSLDEWAPGRGRWQAVNKPGLLGFHPTQTYLGEAVLIGPAASRAPDASGESGLTQLLMTEVMKLQKKVQDLTALLSSKDDFIKELRVKDSLLRKHQERMRRLKEECEASVRDLKRCKDENYDLAMRLARLSEEKSAALMRTRDLQLEVDQLRHNLMKAEDDCKVERKHTLKLRHAMEQQPSQERLWEVQQEKALLQARVQELEAMVQEVKLERSSPYIQVLEEDWRQALRDHQEQATTIFTLRKDLRQAEALRTRV